MRHSLNAVLRILRKPFISLLVRSRVIGAEISAPPLAGQRYFFILESNRFSHQQLLIQYAEARNFPLPDQTILSVENTADASLADCLLDLLKTQRSNPAVDVVLIPVAFFHGTLPRREHAWLNLLYSESWERAGWLGSALQLLINGRQTLMHIGRPLQLKTLLEDELSPERLTQKCLRLFSTHFRQIRKSIIGPDLSHRRTLISLVLKDPQVQKAIDYQAEETGTNRHKIERHCQTTLDHIAADFSPITASLLDKVLNLIWKKLYKQVEILNLDEVHQVAEDHQLIYLPCHRSHMDYLLLSWALYRNGLTIPHVAAGENLNIPVIGPILKKGGAIFMRRKFSGDRLYHQLYQTYLQQMARRGHALEYFIEGGRSRTGRLLPPKSGLLSMSVENYLNNSSFPVAIVPVWISYDRLIESASYQRELKGKTKQKESVAMVLASLKRFRENFGYTQLSFGKPIALSELIDQQNNDSPNSHQIAFKVMQGINRASCIHSTSLVATLFLSGAKHLTREEAALTLGQLQATLQKLPGHCNYQANGQPEYWLEAALSMRLIQKEGDILDTTEEQQQALCFYRNNIQHLLILPGLYLLLAYRIPDAATQTINQIVRTLYPFLQAELYLPFSKEDLTNTLKQIRETLLEEQLLHTTNKRNWQTLKTPTSQLLMMSAEPIILRYYLVIRCLDRYHQLSVADLEEICCQIANTIHKEYGFHSPEYADPHVLQVFFKQLIKMRLIKREDNRVRLNFSTEQLYKESHKVLRPQLITLIDRCLMEPGNKP